MPFTLVKGTFHLVDKTKAGRLVGFAPDGDSLAFAPQKPSLLDRLEVIDKPYKLTAIGSVQLRFEGIDALELHFRGKSVPERRQPPPLAEDSRDYLTGRFHLNPVPYSPPRFIKVKPPVERDGAEGFILSRALDVHGRPVSFVFVGSPAPRPDGSTVVLKPAFLRKSLNYKSLVAGEAYPLFYETLFADLRATLTSAAVNARRRRKPLWQSDRSWLGLTVGGADRLETDGVIFPKLFRRLIEYYAEGHRGLGGFGSWLEAKREQVLDLTTGGFTHFDNVLEIRGNRLKMLRRPEDLVFYSAKTTNPSVSPWV
jgi:hypothetical protein